VKECQKCGQPATVHVTDIVNRKKRTTSLCEACAREKNLISDDPTPQLNLQPLLQLIMGQMGLLEGSELLESPKTSVADPNQLVCSECQLKYVQFKAEGRLGCPHDYDAFRTAIVPLLERIHRDLYHAGKVPGRFRRQAQEADLAALKAKLTAAVNDERYEEAARLRDLIRAKDAKDYAK
jgi:protein arginine kinase activator